ncbi:MAG: amidohydrolase [Chloroflexi bacterium]|nr:amidohydrolase [Chloroflexota bacterium]
MFIDSHVHVFDTSVPGAPETFPRWGIRGGGGAADLLRQMDEAGIDRAFLLAYTAVDISLQFSPERRGRDLAAFQHYKTRECYLRAWREHPDRFYWFADSIDPRVPGYVERAERDLDGGAAGLKLFIAQVETPMDDPRWEPIFAMLRERRKPCVIDLVYRLMGQPWFAPSLQGKYRNYAHFAEGIHRTADEYGDVPMVLAHYGWLNLREPGDPAGPLRLERIEEPIKLIRAHGNLYADIAAYHHFIQPDDRYPYWSALRIVEALVQGAGADRILFGTDWPYATKAHGEYTYADLVRSLREAPFLGPGEVEKVLGGNALRVLGRSG